MDGRLIRPLGDHPLVTVSKRLIARLKALYYTTHLHRMRLQGKQPLKFLDIPKDPWLGEIHIGAQILNGTFTHGGHSIKADNASPWPHANDAPDLFYSWLHGFSWLRDLELMADKRTAQERAENLVKYWIEHYKSWSLKAWRGEVIGERIISWVFHSPIMLSNSDLIYRSLVMNTLLQQARHLHYTVAATPMGVPRIKACTGLIISGLLIPDGEARFQKGMKVLEQSLAQFILPDGGVATRNPRDGLEVLKNIILISMVLDEQNSERPNWLQFSCDKLVPFLKSLSHGDHGFAHFGGAFSHDSAALAKAIELSDAKGRASNNLPFTGYQRLKQNRTLVLMNVGTPPEPALSDSSPANPLAIEISDGTSRIIVGCSGALPHYGQQGVFEKAGAALKWGRKTCAHSTIEIDQSNASTIQKNGQISAAHFETLFERNESEEGIWLTATHDGYLKKYNIRHTRNIFINPEGNDIRGEDIIERANPKWWTFLSGKKPLKVKNRFHLHPQVSLSPNQSGSLIILRLPNGHGWSFQAKGAEISIDDSLYCERAGDIKKTSQIKLAAQIGANQSLSMKWSFKRLDHRE